MQPASDAPDIYQGYPAWRHDNYKNQFDILRALFQKIGYNYDTFDKNDLPTDKIKALLQIIDQHNN